MKTFNISLSGVNVLLSAVNLSYLFRYLNKEHKIKKALANINQQIAESSADFNVPGIKRLNIDENWQYQHSLKTYPYFSMFMLFATTTSVALSYFKPAKPVTLVANVGLSVINLLAINFMPCLYNNYYFKDTTQNSSRIFLLDLHSKTLLASGGVHGKELIYNGTNMVFYPNGYNTLNSPITLQGWHPKLSEQYSLTLPIKNQIDKIYNDSQNLNKSLFDIIIDNNELEDNCSTHGSQVTFKARVEFDKLHVIRNNSDCKITPFYSEYVTSF